jgi:hypothetical protein
MQDASDEFVKTAPHASVAVGFDGGGGGGGRKPSGLPDRRHPPGNPVRRAPDHKAQVQVGLGGRQGTGDGSR